MKLIIEIDEKDYNLAYDLINGVYPTSYKARIYKAIANGTTYNPTGYLISREALRATIIEPLNVNDACKNDWYEGYYTAKNEDVMAIDNAPTVEYPFYQEAYQTGYEERFNEGAKAVVDTVNKANKTPLYGEDMIRGDKE